MKIAIVSDIHGNLPALRAVVAAIQAQSVQHVFNLGDSLSGPLWPAETADFLMAQPWIQIAGNHERYLNHFDAATAGKSDRYAYACLNAAHKQWLAELPATLMLGQRISVLHGSGRRDDESLLESQHGDHVALASADEIHTRLAGKTAELILCGHSHIPRVVTHATPTENALIVNPGSVGLPAYDFGQPPCYVETGCTLASFAIAEKTPHGWTASLHRVPYDADSSIAQAQRNGRADWAHALRTGYALRPTHD